jgi:hypothetical protein
MAILRELALTPSRGFRGQRNNCQADPSHSLGEAKSLALRLDAPCKHNDKIVMWNGWLAWNEESKLIAIILETSI